MQSPYYWDGNDRLLLAFQRNSRCCCFWDALLDALMRSCSINIRDIRIKYTLQLLFMEDQQVGKRILVAHSWAKRSQIALARGA